MVTEPPSTEPASLVWATWRATATTFTWRSTGTTGQDSRRESRRGVRDDRIGPLCRAASIPSRVPSALSSLVYPDSVTGYLINPNTASGQPYAFLPGCDQASQNANKCTFPFPGTLQSPTTQINLLSKFTKSLWNDWAVTVTGSVFDSEAQQIAATTFGHAFNNTGQEAGSIVNITGSPGQLFGTVVYPVLSLPGTSALNPFGTSGESGLQLSRHRPVSDRCHYAHVSIVRRSARHRRRLGHRRPGGRHVCQHVGKVLRHRSTPGLRRPRSIMGRMSRE